MEKEPARHIALARNEYLVAINGVRMRVLLNSDGVATVNGVRHAYDLHESPEGGTSLIMDGSVFEVAVLARKRQRADQDGIPDASERIAVSVNGTDFEAAVDDRHSLLVKSLMKTTAHDARSITVRAPMPGLIVRIEVEAGQAISAGQGLLVLEAMKMENEIRALQAGRVKEIFVQSGRAVEKDERLMLIDAE
ncbi:MAG: biotin/lipoyl-binding protein [Bacteroidetes bacterium]|nr:biotin/lipoyl-binding protein [Bacteroidota bacterium]